MARPSSFGQSVVAVYGRMTTNRPVATGDTSFWRQFGLPSHYWRTRAIERAYALQEGVNRAIESDFSGPLASIYEGTGFDPLAGDGGPAGTGMATVHWKAEFETNRIDPDTGANIRVIKSGVTTLDWSADLEDVQAEMDLWLEVMEGIYESSTGGFVAGSATILENTITIY